MRCDDRQLKALSQLKDNPHFEVFMKWIVKWLEDETKECIHAEKPAVNQGCAQALEAIVKAVDEADVNFRQRITKREIRASNDQNAF